MPTTYTSFLGLALPATGELSGTWGATVNAYISEYLDSAVAGVQTISGTQTAVALSVANGASLVQAGGAGVTGSAQYMIINCTGTPASLLTITAPNASKVYVVINGTAQSVKLVGVTGPTAGVTLVTGEKAVCAWNGSDFVKVATSVADGVTSVAMTVPTLLSVSGSPITSTGTLALTYSGTPLPVANGGTALTSGTSGGVLAYTASGTLASSAALTASALVLGGGAGATPTPMGSLGTTTTVLHGNAGGAPTFGAVSLTADVSGTLPNTSGGTGQSSAFTQYGVTYASTTSVLATTSAGTSTTLLHGNAAGAPTFGAVSLTADVSGTLPNTSGGTGQSSAFTQYGVTYASTTSVLATTSAGTSTTVLHGNAGGAPTFGAVSLTADVTGNLPTSNLNSGTSASATTFWRGDGAWAVPSGTSSGTVTSVAATVPSIFSISGSPITTSGTLAMTYSGTALPVANGGTSLTTLTANNVILGNGTSAPTFVAPSTSGNVLTSNGTTWASTAAAAGGVSYTAVKTANYTAVNNDGVLTNTTGGAFTVTLPTSPSVGNIVVVVDSFSQWGTNNLTIDPTALIKIAGNTAGDTLVCDITGVSVTLVYTGASYGWNVAAQVGGNGGTAVTLTGTQTLTNKTIAYGSNTLTDVVGVTATQTLTNKTLTAPTIASANLTTALTLAGAAGTNGQVLTSAGSGLPTWATVSAGYTLGTPVLVSGSAAIEFTSLPAGIKNIIVTFYRVSFNPSSSEISIQLGNSGGYVTGATQSQSIRLRDPAAGPFSFSTSTFSYNLISGGSSSDFFSGSVILTLVDSTNNYWAGQGSLGSTVGSAIFLSTATINLSNTLTKLKIVTDNSFDSGTLNIAYL